MNFFKTYFEFFGGFFTHRCLYLLNYTTRQMKTLTAAGSVYQRSTLNGYNYKKNYISHHTQPYQENIMAVTANCLAVIY